MPDDDCETKILQTFDLSHCTMLAFFKYISQLSKYFSINGQFVEKYPANIIGHFTEATKPKDY
jgi:hypothetical protein